MKHQATKATKAQVELHIERQRALGESMIDDDDQPGAWEIISVVLLVIVVLLAHALEWL